MKKEKLYKILTIPMSEVGKSDARIIATTGTIEGEVLANNIRKALSTANPDMYYRMIEV